MARRLAAVTDRVGISIDFYETLVEIDTDVPSIAQALTARGYQCSDRVEAIWNSLGFDGQETRDPEGGSYDAWRRRSLASLGRLCGVPDHESRAVVEMLLDLDQRWTVKAKEGARELIAWLRAAEIPHCILTNWDYPIGPYLRMAGLPEDLPTITSADLCLRKPHVAAFTAARDLLEIVADRHIHIGDSWFADVVGAIRSGGWAIWTVDSAEIRPLPRRIRSCQFSQVQLTVQSLVREIRRDSNA